MDIWPPTSEAFWGLVGVLTGVLGTVALDFTRYKLSRSTHSIYLAVRVITKLDQYVTECSHAIDEIDYHNKMTHPTLSFENLDVDWKSVDADFAYRILKLPTDLGLAKKRSEIVLHHWHENVWQEPVKSEFCYVYASCGLKAIKLADELRTQHSLGDLPEAQKAMKISFEHIIEGEESKREAIHKANDDCFRQRYPNSPGGSDT